MSRWRVGKNTLLVLVLAIALGWAWSASLAQTSKLSDNRAAKMRELAIQWSACTQRLEGPPERISREEREEIYRKRFDLILEAARLFPNGPCPDAIVELLLLDEQPGHE